MTNITKPGRGAVIITRVSTGEQAKHGTSLESQLDACRAKALSLNLPIVAEYEDAGVSGAYLTLRAGMLAALADIQAGRADTLICANLSRYSRDVQHQQQIKKVVQNAGGRIVFCDMEFDDTPEGDLAFTLMGGFAEYERKVIRARTMRGKRKRAEEGQQPQRSRSPYGYHIVTKADILRGEHPADTLGRYFVDEEKAAVARRLFLEYASGKTSLPRLALALNQEGVPTPGKAVAWHEGTIRVILRNPVYKGQPASGKQKTLTDEDRLGQPNALTGRPLTTMVTRSRVAEEEWVPLSAPPLVTEEVWDAVQARFGVMNARYGGSPKQTRMLSGLAVCPHCEGPAITRYQTAHGKTYRYFVCSASRKARWRGLEPICHSDVYQMAVVEDAALTAVREAYTRPEAIKEALIVYRGRQKQRAATPDAAAREVAALEEALAQIGRDEAAAVQAQIAGIQAGASPHAYAAVFADLAARRKDLEDRRGVLARQQAKGQGGAAQAPLEDAELVRGALADAERVLTDPEVAGAKKRQILGMIVQKVVCGKEGARVVFLPGLFGEEGDAEGGSRRTPYTTCMGIKTHK